MNSSVTAAQGSIATSCSWTREVSGLLKPLPTRPITVSSPWQCALDPPCCLDLLSPVKSPFSCAFLLNRGHLSLWPPSISSRLSFGNFPPPFLLHLPAWDHDPLHPAGELMQMGHGAGCQPAQVQTSSPSPSQQLCHVLLGIGSGSPTYRLGLSLSRDSGSSVLSLIHPGCSHSPDWLCHLN